MLLNWSLVNSSSVVEKKKQKAFLQENVACSNAESFKNQESESWIKDVKSLKQELGISERSGRQVAFRKKDQ